MALSNQQKDDLNKSIAGYLKSNNYDSTYAAFLAEANMPEDADEKYLTLLAKKWTVIVRLQKKVSELEQTVSALQTDLANAGTGKKLNKAEALPREPAKHTLSGHRLAVTKVLFHPIFNVCVSASEDTTIKVWDYESGSIEKTLKGHTDAVQDVCFNADGSVLASCSADLSIKLWDFETGNCIKTLNGHDHNISCVQFMPDGNTLVSCSRDKSIKFWDTTSGFCTRTLTGHDQWVRSIRISPDGQTMASCSMDQTIKIWNLKSGECLRTLRDHTHVIETIEFSNSQTLEDNIRKMVADSKDSHANGDTESVMSAATGASEAKSDHAKATGAYLVSGSRDKTIRIWDVTTGLCIKVLDAHDNWVRSVVFHPSGRYLLSSADDKTIRAFDLTKHGRCCKTIESAHPLFVSSIDYNRGSPYLVSGGVDHTLKVWECR